MAITVLRGGSTGRSHHFGPGKFADGYDTVRHGWADPISADVGEVVVQTRSGSPHMFATWIRGPIGEVLAKLAELAQQPGREHLAALREKIASETEGLEVTPAADLARALSLPAGAVAEALIRSRLKLTRN